MEIFDIYLSQININLPMDMKKICFTLILLISASGFSQCISVINNSKSSPFQQDENNKYFYLDASFDVQKGFNIGQTIYEPQGVDYDLELGTRANAFGYYVFYGEFRKMEYSNYGLGIDYYFMESKTFDVAIGANVGGAKINDVTYLGYALRVKPIIDITNRIAIYGKFQYQQIPGIRTSNNKTVNGVFEPYMGIQFKLF